jgi:hypothetical protein
VIDRREAARRARAATTRRLADVPVEGARTWLFRFADGPGLGFVVDKRDGRTRLVAAPWELEAYEAGVGEDAYDLHVDEVHDLDAAIEALLPLYMAHLAPPLPGDVPRVQIFDLTWLEAHLGHAPCTFATQDLRPRFRAVAALQRSPALTCRLEPADASIRARSICLACAKLGRDPRDTAAGFDCPGCGYPSLPFALDDPSAEAYAKPCQICEGPRRPPHPAEIAWRDRRRARR